MFPFGNPRRCKLAVTLVSSPPFSHLVPSACPPCVHTCLARCHFTVLAHPHLGLSLPCHCIASAITAGGRRWLSKTASIRARLTGFPSKRVSSVRGTACRVSARDAYRKRIWGIDNQQGVEFRGQRSAEPQKVVILGGRWPHRPRVGNVGGAINRKRTNILTHFHLKSWHTSCPIFIIFFHIVLALFSNSFISSFFSSAQNLTFLTSIASQFPD